MPQKVIEGLAAKGDFTELTRYSGAQVPPSPFCKNKQQCRDGRRVELENTNKIACLGLGFLLAGFSWNGTSILRLMPQLLTDWSLHSPLH